jgi:hypothetical protein
MMPVAKSMPTAALHSTFDQLSQLRLSQTAARIMLQHNHNVKQHVVAGCEKESPDEAVVFVVVASPNILRCDSCEFVATSLRR